MGGIPRMGESVNFFKVQGADSNKLVNDDISQRLGGLL